MKIVTSPDLHTVITVVLPNVRQQTDSSPITWSTVKLPDWMQWNSQVHTPGISKLDKTNLATKPMFWAMANDGLPGIQRLDI